MLTSNPWEESPAIAQKGAIARLTQAAHAARQAATLPTKARPALRTIEAAMTTIAELWDAHPHLYRQHRRFGSVDAPDVRALCQALCQPGVVIEPHTVDALEALATRTSQLAQEITRSLHPALTPTAPVQEATPPEGATKPGLLGRWTRAVVDTGAATKGYAQQAAHTTLDTGRQGLSLANESYQWAQASALSAATQTLAPGKALFKGIMGLTSGRMLLQSAVNFGGLGVLACVAFPPAIPVLIGLSLMESAVQIVDDEHTTSTQQSAARVKELERQRQQSSKRMASILGMASAQPQVFGTEHIHMTIDPVTTRMDGRILTGRHAGQRLHEISSEDLAALRRFAPDEDTKAILRKW